MNYTIYVFCVIIPLLTSCASIDEGANPLVKAGHDLEGVKHYLGIKMITIDSDQDSVRINREFHFNTEGVFRMAEDPKADDDEIPIFELGKGKSLIFEAITEPDHGLMKLKVEGGNWQDEVTWKWSLWKVSGGGSRGLESTWDRIEEVNPSASTSYEFPFPEVPCNAAGGYRVGVTATDSIDTLELPDGYKIGHPGQNAFGALFHVKCAPTDPPVEDSP
jgi:hypothetical protein